MYQIIVTPQADKQLSKLEKPNQIRIINALERIRVRPQAYLTRLVGQPLYKYRVGDYRLFIEIKNLELVLLVVNVGHRKNVYKF